LHHYLSEHAEKYGYGVVERFVGHGVGTVFHSEPFIYHHRKSPIDFDILLILLLNWLYWLRTTPSISE
jgi:methionine aminopeptidase